jgi:hypothetical protein
MIVWMGGTLHIECKLYVGAPNYTIVTTYSARNEGGNGVIGSRVKMPKAAGDIP